MRIACSAYSRALDAAIDEHRTSYPPCRLGYLFRSCNRVGWSRCDRKCVCTRHGSPQRVSSRIATTSKRRSVVSECDGYQLRHAFRDAGRRRTRELAVRHAHSYRHRPAPGTHRRGSCRAGRDTREGRGTGHGRVHRVRQRRLRTLCRCATRRRILDVVRTPICDCGAPACGRPTAARTTTWSGRSHR